MTYEEQLKLEHELDEQKRIYDTEYRLKPIDEKKLNSICTTNIVTGLLKPANITTAYQIGFYAYLIMNNTSYLADYYVQRSYEVNVKGSIKNPVICAAEDTCVVKVNGDTTISVSSGVPLLALSHRVVIEGYGTLTLITEEEMQPCIGPKTNTRLSNGRYQTVSDTVKKIVIDGVKVICKSATQDFTLGAYGSNKVPEIELMNDGSLECPEMHGIRTIVQYPIAPEGSTKLDSLYYYRVFSQDVTDEEKLTDNQKTLRDKLPEEIRNKVTYTTPEYMLKYAAKLLHDFPFLDVSPFLIPGNKMQYAATSSILGWWNKDTEFPKSEQSYELMSGKAGYFDHFCPNSSDYTSIAISMIRYLNDTYESCDYLQRLCYELIPAYHHTFDSRNRTYEEEWNLYLENNKELPSIKLSDEFYTFYDNVLTRRPSKEKDYASVRLTALELFEVFKKATKLELVQDIENKNMYRECSGKSFQKIKNAVSKFNTDHKTKILVQNDAMKDATYIIF